MFPVCASLLSLILSDSFSSAFGSIWLAEICNKSLGLQDGRVFDSQLSAPSFYENFYIGNGKTIHTKPQYARLNNTLAWCATGGRNHYIQVDLKQSLILTGIATQGFSGVNDYFVKTFRVVYSRDGVQWHNNKRLFAANSDSQTVVKNMFTIPISGRYVRVHPVSFKYNICLRMELYGCSNSSTVQADAKSSVSVSTTPTNSTPAEHEIHNSRNSGGELTTSRPQDSFTLTTPVPNITHTPSRAVTKVPTSASRNVSVITRSSFPWSVPSEETVGEAEKGANMREKPTFLTGLDPVIIGAVATASLFLFVVLPFVMFLFLYCRQRHKRCSSTYKVGSCVLYGMPLTSGVHESDKDAGIPEIDQINSTKEQFATDEINLLGPSAV